MAAPASNPFGAPAAQVVSNPFGAPAAQVLNNPFGKPPAQAQQAKNPFGAPQSTATSARGASPFPAQAPPAPLGPASANALGRRNKSQNAKPPAQKNSMERQNRQQQPRGRQARQTGSPAEPSERTKQLSPFAFDYATKLYGHLRKENITPPQWPAEPGNPEKRAAVESLKEGFKKYRSRVYASLRKADLIDDPEKRRKLEDALPFKGICEEMCPEFERVARIAEYDVKTEEKETRPDGLTMWPDTARMVKKFGRSAAGQDAPLPMDVRSVDALRRTTDYLFNDLLQSENNLPSMHNFLWDRTRAVRKDFTFHSQKSPEEMKEMVFCFETITRFHATSLHLLSKKGFANEDFDQKQEIEQLGRTILSLIEAYDVCRDKRVHCENEPEFRAYYLLLNAHDPSIARRIPTWGKEYWFESEEVQTALSLIQAMEDVREFKGPIKPRRPTSLADTSFANYLSIVEDPRVSYTMACVAEIHFTTVRQAILKNLVRAYARSRDAPRTITAANLNALLRFDTPEEAVEFAVLHDFEFTTWVPEGKPPVSEPYLLLNNRKKHVPSPRVRQAFSGKLVERKRTTQSLPHVIYNTIFEEPGAEPPSAESSPDGLFVSRTTASGDLSFANSSTFVQSAQPATAAVPSPFAFGAANNNTALANAGVPAVAAAPSFGGFQPSAPSVPATSSLFSSSNQPAPPAANPPEAANPFGFLKGAGFAQAPSAPAAAAQQPAPQLPAAPSLSAFAAKPTPAATLPQETQSKPTPTFSFLGSAAPAGTPSAPTATPQKPTEQRRSSVPPEVPAITLTPPSFTQKQAPQYGRPVFQDTVPKQAAQPSIFQSALAPSASSSSSTSAAAPILTTNSTTTTTTTTPQQPPPPPPPPTPKRNPKDAFTTWFVTGDDGLLEHFTEETLRTLLWDVWTTFQHDEAERVRRAEDEASWRAAREHMTHRLRVKYFYRWRHNARALATRRILRQGREKMRVWREEKAAVERRERVEREAVERERLREVRREGRRRAVEDAMRMSALATAMKDRRKRGGSVAFSAELGDVTATPSLVDGGGGGTAVEREERLLLATGVLEGLRGDPRDVARRVMGTYPESELELVPAPPSVSSWGMMQRGDGPSPDMASSVGGDKREGWKTRSLRERFGGSGQGRRSLSGSGAASVSPAGSDVHRGGQTNFSSSVPRKRASSSYPSGRSLHWDLRARGLVPTPDGNWVPEAITKGPVAAAARKEDSNTSDRLDVVGKRKRSEDADLEEADLYEDDAAVVREASPSARKRANRADGGAGDSLAMVEDTRRMLRELKELMDQADSERAAATLWYAPG